MADAKLKQSEHQEDQKLHLEQINQRLQSYLLAQHQQQQKIQEQLQAGSAQQATNSIEPVRPDPKLSDYLFAQSLLAQHQSQQDQQEPTQTSDAQRYQQPPQAAFKPSQLPAADDIYAEGVQEVFGKRQQPTPTNQSVAPLAAQQVPQPQSSSSSAFIAPLHMTTHAIQHALEINPLRIAHSKLPMAMRNRKFGRPSFHAHSQTEEEPEQSVSRPTEIAPAHS